VSGRFKGQGHANELLEGCIEDAKSQGKIGLTVLSSAKKMPFLSDPKFLKYKGFVVADTAVPYFELLYLPFSEHAPVPSFSEEAKLGRIDDGGLVLYYTNQCTFAGHYARLIQDVAQKQGVALNVRKIETLEQAKSCSSAWPTYSLFRNGEFVTNEILSEKKFVKLLEEWNLVACAE
ncbi:MAG: YoaP domain-containing protein, partial [Raoultibacter sp.]